MKHIPWECVIRDTRAFAPGLLKGEPLVTGVIPWIFEGNSNFNTPFDVSLNILLKKQSSWWWLKTIWRSCDTNAKKSISRGIFLNVDISSNIMETKVTIHPNVLWRMTLWKSLNLGGCGKMFILNMYYRLINIQLLSICQIVIDLSDAA